MNSSKTSIELILKEFSDLFSKEVQKLDTLCNTIIEKDNVLIGATSQLVEDIAFLNKGYTNEMMLKKE